MFVKMNNIIDIYAMNKLCSPYIHMHNICSLWLVIQGQERSLTDLFAVKITFNIFLDFVEQGECKINNPPI